MAERRAAPGRRTPAPAPAVALMVALTVVGAVTGCSPASGGTVPGDPAPVAAVPSGPLDPDGASPGPVERLSRAADVLAAAGTSRVRTAVETASGGTRVVITGEGVFDHGSGVGELELTVPEAAGGRAPHDGPVITVFGPGEIYLRNRGGEVPPDTWVRVGTAGVPDGNLVTGGATDPATAAALLRGVTHAEDRGRVRADGDRLWHHRGTVDPVVAARAVRGLPEEGQFEAVAAGLAGREVTFEAWLDDEGLLRRITYRFGPTGTGADGPGRPAGPPRPADLVSTTELLDFGVPVEVRVPPEGEVADGTVAAR
ncbi:hypothetical protein FNQ90_10685 [Streptomyces alkaliphilus]|uniref:LppX_LprAFG lipoprotein n=1 Tax=Streptomyces alkaliphilus TaxID=1472722 RepID=A0A7W3Y1R3_9ACTN|nr:hypothetical protein [Streptomyces alkaliphilus]MBB0244555.1 hypothetical protein [Streptomyces alkaliphilus]